MGSAPKISILSTAYNESLHVAEMIESVLAQTHDNWELLMIDDASTDNTAEIISEYAKQDSRVRLVSQGSKLGKVGAFNVAYASSTGDLVALMGADDVMPHDSLAIRADALGALHQDKKVVGYFKLRTFSESAKFDGQVLPRGAAGSRSGPSLTMSRSLSDLIFPIPTSLISEDTWLGEASAALADVQINCAGVVVHYRIHGGNSNPRHKTFAQMNAAMHKRAAAYPALLNDKRFELPPSSREHILSLVAAEDHRYNRRVMRVLTQRSVPLIERFAVASMSSPILFKLRTHFYKSFSGWRGR